ncbi:exported hypothetical protein [uncultured delta proteobacterium]|uniref:Uncharacterized protein n=1 Tax=uncultured delta proteobacterium TaxID=34034 RepID=A0A212JEX1_9DELT|nr:exported hypothetical protein [uncultured delta proteobacterium]
MPASGSKSRGGGTILLVLLLLLGVAGASAFFIHKILTAEDAPVAATGQAGSSQAGASRTGPSRTGEDLGPPVVLQPGGSGSTASPSAVPQGQFVVPPSQPPPQAPEGTDTVRGQIAGIPGQMADAPLVSPSPATTGDPDARGGLPADPAPNLLLVPGAIETPPPAAREDAVVRPAFVDDIAAFLAQNYWPQNTHPSARRGGITTASLQWANLRYGAELKGLDGRQGDPGGARRAILGYVLNPAVVGRIYGLYSDGFVAALRQEADKRVVGEGSGKRSLSSDEKKEMFMIYSGFAARIAGALENYAADPSMPAKVKVYAQAEQAVQDANRVYLESMLAHEEAVESKDKGRITAAQLRMDKEAATYQKRIRERETAKNALVGAMSKGGSGQGGSDTLVYAAFWASRRGNDSAQALRACAKALGDMSAKLAAASRQM